MATFTFGNYQQAFWSKRPQFTQHKSRKSFNTRADTSWHAVLKKLKFGTCRAFTSKLNDRLQSRSSVLSWTSLTSITLEISSWYSPVNQSLITWVETNTILSLNSVKKISNSQPLSAHPWVICTLETVKEKSMSIKLWPLKIHLKLISSTINREKVLTLTKCQRNQFWKEIPNTQSLA